MQHPSSSARPLDARTTIHAPRLAWRGPRPGRPALVVLLGVAGLLACVYLVLRLTPLSAVQQVTVVGAQGPHASDIRRAVERAAVGQSTLGFHEAAVRDAVGRMPSVTGVVVHTRFPHGVQVEIRQLEGVGAVEVGGRRVAVAPDGRLLPDWAPGKLPLVRGGRARSGALVGGARTAARILGAAPAPLLARVARVDGGTTVRLAAGPALLFRDGERLDAKWAAAVAVLSDPATRGATWIDLRAPEQPVAGRGAPPTLPRRDARVGRIAAADDALVTAEGTAAAGATATTGAPVAGAAAAPRVAAPTAAPEASPTGAAQAPQTAPVAPSGPTAGTPNGTIAPNSGPTVPSAATNSAPPTATPPAPGGALAPTENAEGPTPGAPLAP